MCPNSRTTTPDTILLLPLKGHRPTKLCILSACSNLESQVSVVVDVTTALPVTLALGDLDILRVLGVGGPVSLLLGLYLDVINLSRSVRSSDESEVEVSGQISNIVKFSTDEWDRNNCRSGRHACES